MLFNSFDYVLFFPLVFALYWAVPFRVQQGLLLAASYLFYGWWGFFEPKLSGWEKALPLVLLAASTLLTHVCAKAVYALPEESRNRRVWFWIGVAANLGMLGYFKYRGFLLENVNVLSTQFGWTTTPLVMQFILPAGISFYTFQGLSYLIDVDGGSQKPAERVWDFALFHAFFPQLVAGPIERSRNLLPQLTAPRTLTPEQM